MVKRSDDPVMACVAEQVQQHHSATTKGGGVGGVVTPTSGRRANFIDTETFKTNVKCFV